MKKIRISLPQGAAGNMAQGCAKKLGLLVLGIVAALALLGPSRAAADQSPQVTQLGYLQLLVQLTGDTAKFNPGSTAADYVNWAVGQGLNPTGGWQPGSPLTRDAFGETLVQLFKIAPDKFNKDFARQLAREGITEIVEKEPVMTLKQLIDTIEEFGFRSRIEIIEHANHSPTHCPPGHGDINPAGHPDCKINPKPSDHDDNRGDDKHHGKNHD
jgi:hypothetical protein